MAQSCHVMLRNWSDWCSHRVCRNKHTRGETRRENSMYVRMVCSKKENHRKQPLMENGRTQVHSSHGQFKTSISHLFLDCGNYYKQQWSENEVLKLFCCQGVSTLFIIKLVETVKMWNVIEFTKQQTINIVEIFNCTWIEHNALDIQIFRTFAAGHFL